MRLESDPCSSSSSPRGLALSFADYSEEGTQIPTKAAVANNKGESIAIQAHQRPQQASESAESRRESSGEEASSQGEVRAPITTKCVSKHKIGLHLHSL